MYCRPEFIDQYREALEVQALKTYDYLVTVWPKKSGPLDETAWKGAHWRRLRRRMLDAAFLVDCICEDQQEKQNSDLFADLLFLAGIASVREVIG